jgi:hypothetical protein
MKSTTANIEKCRAKVKSLAARLDFLERVYYCEQEPDTVYSEEFTFEQERAGTLKAYIRARATLKRLKRESDNFVLNLVKEYKADPNCWPELWIADCNLSTEQKQLFLNLTSHV